MSLRWSHRQRKRTNRTSSHSSYKPKNIPFESILQHLTSLTGINTSDVGTHLLESFGANANLEFLTPQLESGLFEFSKPDEEILLSECQSDETSADMNPIKSCRKAYGAFIAVIGMPMPLSCPGPMMSPADIASAIKTSTVT